MPHLRQIISLGSRRTEWVDAGNHHPHLLSYDGLETLGRNFRGTTDVLVADSSAVRALQPELRMRLLFELKKGVVNSDVIRAQASLVLANLLSPDTRPMMVSLEHGLSHVTVYAHALASIPCDCRGSVSCLFSSQVPSCKVEDSQTRSTLMTITCCVKYLWKWQGHYSLTSLYPDFLQVLTDLCDEWHLLWLDSATIKHYAIDTRGQAIGFVEDLLAGRFEASEGVEPNAAGVAKRRKIEDRLIATSGVDDSDAFKEQVESLEGVLARRKIEDRLIATSGVDDSDAFKEQMESLEGVLPPNELMQMRADRLVRLLVEATPIARRPPL